MSFVRVSNCGLLLRNQLRSLILRGSNKLLLTSNLSTFPNSQLSTSENTETPVLLNTFIQSSSITRAVEKEVTGEPHLISYENAWRNYDMRMFNSLLILHSNRPDLLSSLDPVIDIMYKFINSHVASDIDAASWLCCLGKLNVVYHDKDPKSGENLLPLLNSLLDLFATQTELSAARIVACFDGLAKSKAQFFSFERYQSQVVQESYEHQETIINQFQNALTRSDENEFYLLLRAANGLFMPLESLSQMSVLLKLQVHSDALLKSPKWCANVVFSIGTMGLDFSTLSPETRDFMYRFVTGTLASNRVSFNDPQDYDHLRAKKYGNARVSLLHFIVLILMTNLSLFCVIFIV